ncbi:MAG: ferrochelatase [Gammaproteobacteria bacterium]
MSFIGEDNFTHDDKSKIGVLICNLGSPDSYSTKDVRKYLREFLSDTRVIEVPKIIWWLILNLLILPFRPKKSAALYKSVWLDEGSPLIVYSKRFMKKINKLNENSEYSENIEFELAMRYGNPSIESALQSLKEKNCRKILLLPLFPQYSAVTAATIFDKASKILSKWRWIPSLHFVNGYHDNPGYIEALAKSIENHEQYNKQDLIIFSYHGIPKKYFDSGDPYQCFCQKTTRLVAEHLGLGKDQYMISFQSRLAAAGREWLKPYTSEVMNELPRKGVRKVLVLSPGFSMDCLETIEEIKEENKEIFIDAGGESFDYVPCLNDNDEHVKFINDLISEKIEQL